MWFSERASHKNVYDGLGMGLKFYEPTTTTWAILSFCVNVVLSVRLCVSGWANDRTGVKISSFHIFIKTLSKRMKVICLLLLRMKAFTGVPTIQIVTENENMNIETSRRIKLTQQCEHTTMAKKKVATICASARWERDVRYYHQRCWLFRMPSPIR